MRLLRLVGFVSVVVIAAAHMRAQSTSTQVTQTFSPRTYALGASAETFDLSQHFDLPGVTDVVAQIDTVVGKINLQLYSTDAPLTTENFRHYISTGRYANTIIHRSVPGFVIQGGGYLDELPITPIATFAPVANEFKRSNVRGTVAMAKLSGDANSATSQWFINLADNSANLDSQNGGFTVFAGVIGGGMAIADAVARLPTSSDGFPLVNYSSGAAGVQNLLLVRNITLIQIYPDTSGSASVLTFSATSSQSAVAAVQISGSNLMVTPLGVGTTSITVSATDSNGLVVSASFDITVEALHAPTIVAQPTSVSVAAGDMTALDVAATGNPAPAFQWRKDGAAISGATSASLILTHTLETDAASYTVDVSNSQGTITSDPANVAIVSPVSPARLANLSIRTNSGTGNDVLNVGFVVGGGTSAGSKPLLIRAWGPALALPPFNVSGTMVDPALVVLPLGGSAVAAQNDNWAGDAQVTLVGATLGAYPFQSTTSSDSALVTSLAAGPYTALVSGVNNTSGIVLAEVYDATTAFDASSPRLLNVSARAQVNTGDGVLVAGFVIEGDAARTVLIRAVGPRLGTTPFDLPDVLADPILSVDRIANGVTTLVAQNDDWGGSAPLADVMTTVGAFGFDTPTSKDAALLVTLPPGVYSAIASGVSNTTGISLVELYDVN